MANITGSYTQQSSLPNGIKSFHPHPKSPWKLSEGLLDHMQVSLDTNGSCRSCEVLRTDPEYDFVLKCFMHHKPPGLGISKITALDNSSLTQLFESYLSIMNGEVDKFPPSWAIESLADQRKEAHKRWKALRDQFQPLEVELGNNNNNKPQLLSSRLAILPLFHGSDLKKCDSIGSTGFTYFGKQGGLHIGSTDPGIFGSGIYFTDSARYAAMYSPGSILLSFVSMRPPYPVVSDTAVLEDECSDMKKLQSMGAYRDYNAHFIPVQARNDTTLNYYPSLRGHSPTWDEFVVFHASQALPRFRIEMSAELLKNPDEPFSFESALKACQEGNDLLSKWIQDDPTRLTQKTEAEDTWLHIAARYGRDKLVTFLLKDNTLLNLTTVNGWNAFHFAAAGGHIEVARLLLERKPDFINTETPRGAFPIHLAAENGHLDFMQFLHDCDKKLASQLSTIGGWSILHFAAFIGDLSCLQWAFKKTNKNLCDTDGNNALHLAAERGNTQATTFLLDKDSLLFKKLKDQKNHSGHTPLLSAAHHNQVSTLKLLLKHKVNIKDVDTDGYMPIHWVCKRGSLEGLEALIAHKSPLDPKGLYGRTPLHMASFNGRHPLALKLLEMGVDVNAQTDQDDACKTPLHDAVIHNDFNMVQTLLANAKIDVNLRDIQGHTPLWHAVYNGDIRTILILMQHPSYRKPLEEDDPNSIAELYKLKTLGDPTVVAKTLKDNS
ncbi:MAG: Phosphocholine transferase AnkX [Chlamydiae bacterium]|nr:Phosphocholine transferase AnkX [Chlamydiota bacterium]